MPIFYTDNPVNVSASNAVTVTATIASPVSVQTVGPSYVTSSVGSPVWITGTIQSVATQATAFTTGVAYPSSGNLNLYVSGATNATVFGRVGTGTQGSAVLVTLASDQPAIQVSQSNVPAGTVTVTGTVGVWNALTGTIGVWNTVAVSQSNVPAGTVTVTGSVGVWNALTGTVGVWNTVPVSQTNFASAFTASQDKAGNASLTTVEVGNASTPLLAANANRKGATIFSVDATVYVAFGQTPTTALYAAKVPSSSYYEIPYNWTGAINAIAVASGQTVNIQEFTA